MYNIFLQFGGKPITVRTLSIEMTESFADNSFAVSMRFFKIPLDK